jgi:hypothetical protein
VGQCTNLRRLVLRGVAYEPEGYAPLASLAPSLTRLDVLQPESLPGSLSLLSSLRCLTLQRWEPLEEEECEALDEALLHLPALQHLHIDCCPGPPPTLTALTALTSLCFTMAELPEGTPFPSGAWMTGLRVLVAPCWELAATLPALEAATQLRHLGATEAWEDERLLHTIARWAAARPGLRRLLVPAVHFSDARLAAVQQLAGHVAVSVTSRMADELFPPEPVCSIWPPAAQRNMFT